MKPQVRIIDAQKEEISSINIDQNEAEALLAKYGHSNTQPITTTQEKSNDETFEEMIRREESKNKPINTPNTISRDGYTTETKWGSDPELGINFKINISTDMKIPK